MTAAYAQPFSASWNPADSTTTVWQLMERFNPALLMILLDVVLHAGELSGIESTAREMAKKMNAARRRAGIKEVFVVDVDQMTRAARWDAPDDRELFHITAELARQHGMTYTARALQDLADHEGKVDALRAFPNLKARIRDELDEMVLLWIESDRRPYLENEHPFGPQFSRRFPQAVADAQAASRAFARGMHAACVFHLVRALEHVLRALAALLGAPTPVAGDRSWQRILDNLKSAIDALPDLPKGRKQPLRAAHGLLSGVKDAWRNDTMHVDATYEAGDALRIYNAVAGFAANLAKVPRTLR